MSFSSAVSSWMTPIPYSSIPGFDNDKTIPKDVMGIIAEYVGCIAGQGQEDPQSWSVHRHHEYFRVLFEPRLIKARCDRIAQWNNELNKEYASYQNFKRIEYCWKLSRWLLSNHSAVLGGNLQSIAEDWVLYSSPTLRQYWVKYLASLHHAFFTNTPPRHLAHLIHIMPNADEHTLLKVARAALQAPSADPRVLDIQSVCDVLEQENNGAARVVFPVQRLRAMIQSTRETFYADIASCDAQRARNVRSRSIFKKVLDCAVAVCLIARRILSEIIPPLAFWKKFTQGVLLGFLTPVMPAILIDGPRTVFAKLACRITLAPCIKVLIACIAIFHIVVRVFFIYEMGVREAWGHEKHAFKNMTRHIGHIWRSRELITDVLIEGATAHASVAMKSIRQLGPIAGLRHGYRVLSRIARQGLA